MHTINRRLTLFRATTTERTGGRKLCDLEWLTEGLRRMSAGSAHFSRYEVCMPVKTVNVCQRGITGGFMEYPILTDGLSSTQSSSGRLADISGNIHSIVDKLL